tara:strand:+ start:26 stop:649 length:624 start_codon:yes stop_codon:yes gene_type:complete
MKRYIIPFVSLTLSGLLFADNHSQSLFNGKDLTGWQDRNGNASKWEVVDGNLQGKKKLGDIWSKERFGDFVLSLEFKTTGNSGIFFRTDNPKNPVQTGIEVQVERPNGPNKHSVGALYDLVPPKKNNATKGWNKVKITAKDNMITIEMNGEVINGMDLNKWTESNKNPDGSKNKFKTPLKDFKREGHIGFQDHGHLVSYRNIKIKKL